MSANQLTPNPPLPRGEKSKERKGFWHGVLIGPGGAATIAGSCEIVIFHPFDTTAKRLMSHRCVVVDTTSVSKTWDNVKSVFFSGIERGKAPGTPITFTDHVRHLYPGSSYAVMYKVMQRVIKFAGQPYMKDFLENNFSHIFLGDMQQRQVMQEKSGGGHKNSYGAMMLEATAGCLVGICEVILLPIDRMKVLNQTNKTVIQNRSFASVVRQEGIVKMYAGIGTTAVRNAPGSFLLFGGAAFTKERLFHLENYREATFFENLVSSTVGSCLGVFFTSPMDVVKTRIQNKKFDEGRVTGWSIVKDTIRTEGFGAFYKGISPKVITTAPRLVFSYTLTQFFTGLLCGEGTKKTSSKSQN